MVMNYLLVQQQLTPVQLRLPVAWNRFCYLWQNVRFKCVCNFSNTALVTLSTRSSTLESDVLVGFVICGCSSSCSTCLRLRTGRWSCSLKIADFLFNLVDTLRDMLEKRTIQHQYWDKMDHSDLHVDQTILVFGKAQDGRGKSTSAYYANKIVLRRFNCLFLKSHCKGRLC